MYIIFASDTWLSWLQKATFN